jgi:branched-chain amino acid transport system substrate-binding protein
MNTKKTIGSVFLAGFLVVALLISGTAGCAQPAPVPAPAPAPVAKVLTFGSILPMSGPISIVGLLWSRGFETFFDKINEQGGVKIGGDQYTIKYIPEDDKGSAEAGATAARKLIYQDDAKFICASIMEPVTEAVYGVCEEAKVMHMIPTVNVPGVPADISPKKPYLVRLSPSFDETHTMDFDYLKKAYPSVKTVAISAPDFGYEPMIEDCKFVAQQRGMEVIHVEEWAWGTLDFVPVFTRILAKKPDAIMIMISGQSPDQLRAARQLGFKGPIFGNCPLGAEIHVAVVGPELCTDFFCNGADPEDPTEVMAEGIKRWEAKYKEPYISDSTLAWDVGMVWIQAMQKAQSIDPEKILATLDTMTKKGDLQTVFGPAYMGGMERFGVNRTLIRPIPITLIMNGKMELIGYEYGSNR